MKVIYKVYIHPVSKLAICYTHQASLVYFILLCLEELCKNHKRHCTGIHEKKVNAVNKKLFFDRL